MRTEAHRRYYEKNRERLNTQNKAYREANKERLAAQQSSRRQADIDAARAKDKAYDEGRKEKRAIYREQTAEERKRKAREYYAANRERILANGKMAHIRRTYGLTNDQYIELMAVNDGRCWICNVSESTGRTKELSVDHCHQTGQARGILCFNCNTSIGKLGDNLESLRRVVAYLEKFEANSVDGAI